MYLPIQDDNNNPYQDHIITGLKKKNTYLLIPFRRVIESIILITKNKPAKPSEPTPVNHKILRNISGNIINIIRIRPYV